MVRLRNIKSGAIVNVAEEKVGRLGSDWIDADAPEKRGPGRPKKPTEASEDGVSTDED